MLGAEFLLGEPVSLFGDRLACAIVAFLKNPDNKPVKRRDNFLRLRRLSGFLLQIGCDSLDIVFYFLLLGMSDHAQAQQPRYQPITVSFHCSISIRATP